MGRTYLTCLQLAPLLQQTESVVLCPSVDRYDWFDSLSWFFPVGKRWLIWDPISTRCDKKRWKWLLRGWRYSYYAIQSKYLLEEDNFLLLRHSSFFQIELVRPQDVMGKRYFRLPPRCSWGLCSSEMLRCISRYLVTDVSGWPISPLDFLSPEDGTDRLSWNVGNRLPIYPA